MKKLFLLIITTCIASLGAWGQTSSVSATITDSTSQAYANGTYDILFRPAPGVPGTPTRSGSAFTQHFSGVLDASGAFAVTLTRNDFIQPAGSQWTFTICPLAASACLTSNQTIAAASVNLTSALHIVTPIITVFSLGNVPAAYTSSEIVVTPNPGSFFWNLTTGTFNFWNGTSWTAMILPTSNITFSGGGSLQGVWAAGPTYNIVSCTESGSTATCSTTVPCSAITGTFQSIVVTGNSLTGYNQGPGGLIGFPTASACVGSTFTYINNTTGLGTGTGGTVTVSPIFSQGQTHTGPETHTGQFTTTNENQFFHVPPGSLITIDGAILNCFTGTACPVIISPQAVVSDSAGVITTSIGYKVYCGPIGTTATITDWRKNLGSAGAPAGVTLYPVIYFGRDAGQITMTGTNFCVTGDPGDSAVASTNFMWFHNGINPANNGAIMGLAGLVVVSGSYTLGSSFSPLVAGDFEAIFAPTSTDKSTAQVAAVSAQVHMAGGALESGDVGFAVDYSAKQFDIGALVTGYTPFWYGFDGAKNVATPTSGNWSYHSYGNWITEAGTEFDGLDIGFNISSVSESGSTVTVTVSGGPCSYIAGQQVRIFNIGGTNPSHNAILYWGLWPVVSPCGGGSTFTYTDTKASGLTTVSGSGVAQGVHALFATDGGNNTIFKPVSDTLGWQFETNNNLTRFWITNSGGFFAGTLGCQTAAGCFAGGTGGGPVGGGNAGASELAGIYFRETSAPTGAVNDTVCGAVTTGHTFQCSFNNDGPFSLGRTVGFGTVTLGAGAVTTNTCQTTVTSAVTGAVITDRVDWAYQGAPGTADGLMHVSPYLSSGTIGFTRCNATNASQTGTAIVITWSIVR